MKIIQIDQPWASLIVSGVMDVAQAMPDERNYRGPAIVVSTTKDNPEDELNRIPYEWVQVILNSIYTGNLPEFEEMPLGKAVGIVDIIDCVDEVYSMWDNNDGKPKFRLSNARILKRPLKGWKNISEDNIPPTYVHKKSEMKLEGDKFIIPVGKIAFERYSSGEYHTINFMIDEEIERSGIFPDLTSYDTKPIKVVELVCGSNRTLFDVIGIEAGVKIGSDGEEIYIPSIYEEKRPFEVLIIHLGMRKMWLV